jgi:hypothetical protein
MEQVVRVEPGKIRVLDVVLEPTASSSRKASNAPAVAPSMGKSDQPITALSKKGSNEPEPAPLKEP